MTPVVRCASSQMIRSNRPNPSLLGLGDDVDRLVGREDDRHPVGVARARHSVMSDSTSVEAGTCRSFADMSSSPLVRLPA